jgi:hypothetical protein
LFPRKNNVHYILFHKESSANESAKAPTHHTKLGSDSVSQLTMIALLLKAITHLPTYVPHNKLGSDRIIEIKLSK